MWGFHSGKDLKNVVYGVVTMVSLAGGYRCLGGTQFLHNEISRCQNQKSINQKKKIIVIQISDIIRNSRGLCRWHVT